MLIGIPKEIEEGERRVALTPESARHLIELGFDLEIERGAGAAGTTLPLPHRGRARAVRGDRPGGGDPGRRHFAGPGPGRARSPTTATTAVSTARAGSMVKRPARQCRPPFRAVRTSMRRA